MEKPIKYTHGQLCQLLDYWENQKRKGNKEAEGKIQLINKEFEKLQKQFDSRDKSPILVFVMNKPHRSYQSFYLNNSGSRWITCDQNGSKVKANVFFPEQGGIRQYAISFFEAIGNFVVAYIRIKGQRVQLMEYKEGVFIVNNEANRKFKYGG